MFWLHPEMNVFFIDVYFFIIMRLMHLLIKFDSKQYFLTFEF